MSTKLPSKPEKIGDPAAKKKPSGLEAILLLLQGYPANTVNLDNLAAPFAEVARSIIANDGVDRMTAYKDSLAPMSFSKAHKVNTVLMAKARKLILAKARREARAALSHSANKGLA